MANTGKLAVFCLGGLRIERGGAPLTQWASHKAEALVAYLAVSRRVHERESLATLFWDNRTSSRALRNLNVLLSSLRANLDDLVVTTQQTVSLDWEQDIWVDATHLAQQLSVRVGDEPGSSDLARLEQAVKLYQDDFLAGFHVRQASGFEDWALLEREHLHHLMVQGLETLVHGLLLRQRYGDGISYAQRLVALDPLRERGHRDLMRLYALDGQRPAALAQYDQCFEILQRELGVEPDDETTALYEQIASGSDQPVVSTTVAATRPTSLHNLPQPLTSFVGRTAELNQIKTRLDNPACRLLTVLGPGGVGKTRLALHAARDRIGQHLDGVWFVSLAALTDAVGLASAIAAALNLTFSGPTDPTVQLVQHLRDKETLLLLDNFEHLLPKAAGDSASYAALDLICEILTQAPEVRLLITSRARLNLQAEWLLDLHGLPYPTAAEASRAGDYAAVQLLARRAQRARPSFSVAPQNQADVARVCQLVDGVPLALELAATWSRSLTMAEIAAEIERSVDFLATAMRDIPARHRSLRAVFDHSWAMLTPAEQTLFSRLAVFRGGFAAQAAREVADASRFLLSGLADKSFLERDADGRYRRHPLLWQFAAEKLAADAALHHSSARKHASYFAGLLMASETGLRDAEARAVFEILQPDLDNIRLAWQWATAQADTALIERCVSPLFHLYALAGLLEEGQHAFAAAAARLAQDRPGIAARLRGMEARFLLLRGRFAEADALAEPAAEQAVQAGNGVAEAWARLVRGEALWRQGRYEKARGELDRTLALAQTHHLPEVEGYVLRHIGIVINYHDADYDAAGAYFLRSRELFERLGDVRGETETMNSLGILSFLKGDFPQSKVYHGRVLANSRARGDRALETLALNNLGNVHERLGDYAEAQQCYKEGRMLARELGKRQTEGSLAVNTGLLMQRTGQYARAQALYEETRVIAEETHDPSLDAFGLYSLALLKTHLDAPDAGFALARQAYELLQEMKYPSESAMALHRMGRALTGLGRYAEARNAFSQALDIRRELEELVVTIDSLTGLADIAWRSGDLVAALVHVGEILEYFRPASASQHDEPGWVFITCYRILAAAGDPHAAQVLADAHAWLQEQAAKISDEAMRVSFLENVPANAAITEAYRSGNTDSEVSDE